MFKITLGRNWYSRSEGLIKQVRTMGGDVHQMFGYTHIVFKDYREVLSFLELLEIEIYDLSAETT